MTRATPEFVHQTRGGSQVRIRRYRTGERQPRHAHGESSFSLVLRGSVEETVGSSVEPGTPLCVVVKPAGVEHADVFGREGAALLQISLSAGDESLAVSSGHWPGRWAWSRANDALFSMLRMVSALERARSANGSPTVEDFRRPVDRRPRPEGSVELDDLLLEALASIGGRPARLHGDPPAWLARVRHALEQESISIRALAASERVHPVVLARLFRRAFGSAPSAFRRRARARRAAILLSSPRRTLCEIALEAGFADQSHLTRELRAVAGMTPAALRGLAGGG